MADILLRLNKDVLVLSSPVQPELERLGENTQRDLELTILLEPEVIEDAYKLQQFAGAQCFVAPTASLTPARLAQVGMREQGEALAKAALAAVRAFNPQHTLVELAPCGLPLDTSSKQSLNENSDQYKRAALLFKDQQFDAYFLNGFAKCADLKCALIGIRKVSDAPIFASVNVDAEGMLTASQWSNSVPSGETLSEAVSVMAEYGAQVVGFSTTAGAQQAAALVEQVHSVTFLPVLAQLEVCADAANATDIAGSSNVSSASAEKPTESLENPETSETFSETLEVLENTRTCAEPYAEPDSMFDAADLLYEAGVQFLRATGVATPAYTGALVAATEGNDVVLSQENFSYTLDSADEPLENVAERLRQKVNSALGNK